MRAQIPRNPVFDKLLERAVPVVMAGEHQQDTPPTDGGRWPLTVVCVPPVDVRRRLEGLMREVVPIAGPGHFLTGRADTSHLTVRALEPYRDAASPTDPVTAEWFAAMRRAAAATPALRFQLTGLTLTSVSVMAQVEPLDEEPWRFMRRLRDELGPLAWYEDDWMERNIWYANVLHFAAPIRDAAGLVEWVRAHREIEAVDFTVDGAQLVRSRHTRLGDEQLMAMQSWTTVPFAGAAPAPRG